MAKRQWSREFTPPGERRVDISVSRVPIRLRQRFAAKCKRVGKSQRNLILGWIRNWVEDRRPDEDNSNGVPMAGVASQHDSV